MNISSFGRRLLQAADGTVLGTIVGLGTAAYKNTGTSGNNVPLLDGANTWSAIQTFSANPSVTGGAISFPATQVASAGANDLDDYEEGSFTPTIVGTTTAGTGTYSSQIGSYVKVGRLVTYIIQLVWTAHTGTGNLQINGLPFSVATVVSPISIEVESLTFTGVPQGYASGTSVSLFGATTGAAATGIAMDTAAAIRVSGFYYA